MTPHKCPTCGVEEGAPCRTPKGRKKDNIHDTRPFSLSTVEIEDEKQYASSMGGFASGVADAMREAANDVERVAKKFGGGR